MSISDSQYIAWLSDPTAIRCTLVEAAANVSGTETTRYMATTAFTTSSTDTIISNQYYQPIIASGIRVTESISLDNSPAFTVGDVEILNIAGERDSWLDDVWTNRSLKAFIGDLRWDRSDFRPIFNGIISDIDSKKRDRINLVIADKFQRLNTPIVDLKLGGVCTYTQTGTSVSVSHVSHGRRIGSSIQIQVATGGSASGSFVVASSTNVDTFVYTSSSSLTTSGTLTIVGTNADQLIPVTFGEVFNVTPLLTDPVSLEYQVHNGAVEDIFEVRDNGKPINTNVTKNLSSGKFNLSVSPAGTITASVQGDKPSTNYYNDISNLIQRIVTGYGKTVDRFITSDLDTANLSAFTTSFPQKVGLYLSNRTNVINACQELASSVGAQISMSRAGLLRLLQITLPVTTSSTFSILPIHQIDRTISVVKRTQVQSAVKIGYCKNYTVQGNLLTSIPAEAKSLFALEFLSQTAIDSAVQTKYKLNAEPVEIPTCLLVSSEAIAECNRRLSIVKTTRTTYRFEGTAALLQLELGQAVTLFNNRFGLSSGKTGVVTSLSPDWMTGKTMVEVMI